MSNQPKDLKNDEFTSAVEMLHSLISKSNMNVYSLKHSPATVYTTLATLWMLTLQRLGKGMSLEAIVRQTLAHHREIFPDNKRVREGTLSKNTSGFSQARQQLPIETAERFLDDVAKTITDACPRPINGRKTFIIDGTTFKLPPTSNLREVYPPATNQHGETVWPIMMLTVAHELRSGAALRPEFGAMYGPKNTSEAKQAVALAKRLPANSVVLADSGFGIFSVVYAVRNCGHDVLFRLTKARFKSMRRQAELIDETETTRRYRLCWKPSSKDRRTNPDLPAQASVAVDLHEVELENGECLYLVANMNLASDEAGAWYARRYDVEHDIRDVKVTLGVEDIRAKSDEMVRKEILCSMVAYNLVVQLRREAATVAKVHPRRLSFKCTWYTMQTCLLHRDPCDATAWQERYEAAVQMASTDKLPNRPGRSSPRRAHPKRPKSTKFMKKQSNTPPHSQPPPPPK